MSKWTRKVCATAIALALAGTAVAQTVAYPTDAGGTSTPPPTSTPPVPTTSTAPGQGRVAEKFSAPFISMAGSRENATALANALRTGSPVTLSYASTASDGTVSVTTVTITPPTKPMGWGNVKHSLALAQFALAQAGVTSPTGEQLQAALQGGSVTTADGKTVTLDGVLQQRADGMGWGKIAQSYGTTMGAVNRGVRTSPTPIATTGPIGPTSSTSRTMEPKAPTPTATTHGVTTAGGTSAASVQSTKGMTTAGGTSPGGAAGAKGITTAGGTSAGTGHGAKGITTASGAASSGIVTADGGGHGNGNAYGRGVVTASGSAPVAAAAGAKTGASSGIVTGNTGASGVVTADPGNGGGSAKVNHGKGKGGG